MGNIQGFAREEQREAIVGIGCSYTANYIEQARENAIGPLD
jgi:hypothetical protein